MKSLILSTLAIIASLTTFANAAEAREVQVLSITQTANMMPPRPPSGAAITSTIKVQYEACAIYSEDNFEIFFAREGGDQHPTMLVEIAHDTIDCMGMRQTRTIDLVRRNFPLLEKVIVVRNRALVELDVDQQLVH